MEIVHNELSESPLSDNKISGNEKLFNFITTYVEARKAGFKAIRFPKSLQEINLASDYTVLDWLTETKHRIYKEILLSAFRYPFIEEGGEQEDVYLANNFYYEDNSERLECLGLAAAHIYNTLSISFADSNTWRKSLIPIIKIDSESLAVENIQVGNVFSPECLSKEIIKNLIESISEIDLVEATQQSIEKIVHLRDDHGRDVLAAFAQRLINSPYVVSVINSMPFNPTATRFIKRTFPNGIIEVVLYRDDRGIGMVIQTTGRNLRETQEIAKILEDSYY